MSHHWPDGGGPKDRDAARRRVAERDASGKHKRPKGSPDDLATRDGDLNDPAHQKKED